jgi:hypothetical protein
MEENESVAPNIAEESGFDVAQMEKIISMVRLIKGLSDMETKIENNEEEKPAYSEEVQALNALNAAVPYLDYKLRKPVGIMVKLIEMNRLINNFEVMSMGEGEDDASRKRKMLLAVREELDEKKRGMLDIFMRIMEIREISRGL